jgi:hypothetical protein
MRQALHVFWKDVRYLRLEILLLVALCAIFVWSVMREFSSEEWSEPILMLAAAYLIIRVIHAEPLVGDKQFWITRPYRWGSLLAAKLLFLIVAINLPILAARFLILVLAGFPVIPNLPGLVLSQCFLMVTIFLPIAAIASLTSGLPQSIFSTLVLLAVLKSGIATSWIHPTPIRWAQDVWFRSIVVDLLLLAAVSVILTMQYRTRRTLFSRLFAIGAGLAGFAIFAGIPISLQLEAQSRLADRPPESTAIQMAVDSNLKGVSNIPPKSARFQIAIPLLLSGVQENREVRVDAIEIAFDGTGGATRIFDLRGLDGGRFIDNVYVANVWIDDLFFEEERGQPVNIRVSAHLTLFGRDEQTTYALRQEPVNVTDSLQAFTRGDFVHFRTVFRMPAQLINARIGTLFTADVSRVSYSPFPARPDETSLNPLNEFSFGPPAVGSMVTVIRKDPIAHFIRTVELSGVRLSNFSR